jgi:hypothetical protein
MHAAIQLIRTNPDEQQLKEARANLQGSFTEAQAVWEEYRSHLRGHGILAEAPASTQV